jgi:hypothetical protein
VVPTRLGDHRGRGERIHCCVGDRDHHSEPTTVASVSILGTETTIVGGRAAGVGGGTVLGAVGVTAVVAAAFVTAATTVIAIDARRTTSASGPP